MSNNKLFGKVIESFNNTNTNILNPGDILKLNKIILSDNHNFYMTPSLNGTLEIYKSNYNIPVWSSNISKVDLNINYYNIFTINDTPPSVPFFTYAYMTRKGILVFINNNKIIWYSPISKPVENSYVKLENDGSLSIYSPDNVLVWSTKSIPLVSNTSIDNIEGFNNIKSETRSETPIINNIPSNRNNLELAQKQTEEIKNQIANLEQELIQVKENKYNFTDITNQTDVNNILVDNKFRLIASIPLMPPYIKGDNFDTEKGRNPNYFYLCVETLDKNCSLKSNIGTGACYDVFADNRQCNKKPLTTFTGTNSTRLVLISDAIVNDVNSTIGKNCDWTIKNFNNNLYLQNVQTGFMLSLYKNYENILIHGNMVLDKNTNVLDVKNRLENDLCNVSQNNQNVSETQFVRCNMPLDHTTYIMLSDKLQKSSPINIQINSNKTISINLIKFDMYGQPINTDIYTLRECDFNIKNLDHIEKITKDNITYMVNTVCIHNNKRGNSNKTLEFKIKLNTN